MPTLVGRQLLAAKILSESPEFRYTWSNWDDYRNEPVNGMTVAEMVLTWCKGINRFRIWDAWFFGSTGVGKDHMAHIVATVLATRLNWTAYKIDWVVACEQMKYGSGENFEFGPYKESDILIVSDVDRPDYTLFVNRKLGELVRSREDKVTIWTSNTPLDTFCRRIETSSRRDERSDYNGVGKMQAAKMRETAVTIRSRLKGQMGLEIPFKSKRGDWREKRE